MADIFLSYAREDRERASQLASALGAAGHDVFWDVEIPPGMSWADFLEEKLAASKAALVLWSKTSTASQWVREEARLARDRGKLIPVMLDDSAPPFGFGEIQAANLAHWRGDANDQNFRLLLSAVERSIGAPARPPTPQPQRPSFSPPPQHAAAPPAEKKKTSAKTWWIAGGVAAVGVLALIGASMEDDGGLAPTAPNLAAIAPPTSNGTVSASVTQVLEQVRQIQIEAQANASQAVQAAAQAQQAAAQAQSGAAGFGTTGAANNFVSGNLAALQSGQPAAVMVQGAGNQFAGLVTMNPATGRYIRMVGANQGLNGLGSQAVTTFSDDALTGRQVGRYFAPSYSAEGSSEGALAMFNFTGLGVVQYADGARFAGQYRIVGAEARIVKQGYGALYNSAGAIVQAGRFENDSFAGPN